MLPTAMVPDAVPALACRLTSPLSDLRLTLPSAMLPPVALAPVMAKLLRQPAGQVTLDVPGESAGRLPLTPPPVRGLEASIVYVPAGESALSVIDPVARATKSPPPVEKVVAEENSPLMSRSPPCA